MRDRLDAIASIAYYAVSRTSPLASALSAAVLCAAVPFVVRTSVPRRATPVAEAFDVGMMHVERFGTKHPIVVGHSLGGTVAVLFGATHADQPGAIIAVEGGYPVAPTAAERATRVEESAAPYDSATPSTLASVLRARMLRYVITSPADVDSVAEYASRSDPAAIAAWLRAALSLDLTGQLPAITAPLLEIVPFDSTIDPYQGFATRAAKAEAYTAWLSHAPHGSLRMVAPSRHFVMFDRPAEFDDLLLTAIRQRTAQLAPNS